MFSRVSRRASMLALLSLAGSSFIAPVAHAQAAPAADIIDLDLSGGVVADSARGVTTLGPSAPEVHEDSVIQRPVATFNGRKDAIGFDVGDQFDQIKDGFTVECAFRYDGAFDGNEKSLCANKEAGGWAMVVYGDQLTFTVHVGGYKKAQMQMKEGQWYHAVGVFDGNSTKLYVNGQLVDENTDAVGEVTKPKESSTAFMLGADSGIDNAAQFYSAVTLAEAKLFSQPVSDSDVAALYDASGLHSDLKATIVSSSPKEGTHITEPVTFSVELNNEELAPNAVYTLDGKPIEQGELIGAGLTEGEHTIEVSGHDVFGNDISDTITFTSGNIPGGAGTASEQDGNDVVLAVRADNPSGGELTTTFTEATVDTAQGGVQGVIKDLPKTLEFDYEQGEKFDTVMARGAEQATASASDMPFQRFDIAVQGKDSHTLVWNGAIDPKRAARLYAWNTASKSWELLAETRGAADKDVALNAEVNSDFVDGGIIHTMVVGYDVFADDLNQPVKGEFENPADYDFAIAHHTDTQYLTQGGVIKETAEERAKWEEAYTSVTQWIADNAKERKIVYSAHTGDITESWTKDTSDLANSQKEYELASRAQKILEDAGIVNGVIPGNHDNKYGKDTGTESLYNQYFGPERYEAQEGKGDWVTYDASYQPWKPGDNDNHYELFSAAGLDFVAVSLGYDVTEEEAAWADSVLKQYSDRNAIVLTHAYNKPSVAEDGRGGEFSHDGLLVSEKVVAANPNVALVLSGHEHGVSIGVRHDMGAQNNHVVELLADYQFYEVGSDELGLTEVGKYGSDTGLRFGSSFLRLLQFDLDKGEMVVDTFSPLLDNYGATEYDDRARYAGKEDEFRVPIQFSTRTTSFTTKTMLALTDTGKVIGEDTAKSGWPAEVVWSDRTPGTTYGWFATSRDAAAPADTAGVTRQFGVFTAKDNGSTPATETPQPPVDSNGSGKGSAQDKGSSAAEPATAGVIGAVAGALAAFAAIATALQVLVPDVVKRVTDALRNFR